MASMPPPPPPPFNPWDRDAQRDAQKHVQKMQREAMRQQERAFRYQAKMQRDQYRLRTGSILGPILLIGFGVLFLLATTGRVHIYSLAVFLGPWWPMFLVLAGVIRLAEWAWDRQRQANWLPGDPPVVRSSLGGGVTALIILLCVVLAAVHFTTRLHANGDTNFFDHGFSINPDNVDEFFGDKHESTQALDQTLPAGAVLTLNNPRGNVTVTGNSPDQQMHVILHREVYTYSDSDAEKKAKSITANPQISGNAVSLVVPTVDGARVTVEVTLPMNTMLNATVNRGDLSISGLRGSVNATANHGDLDLGGITGPVSAHLNRSDSDLNAHDIDGALSLEGRAQNLSVSNLTGLLSLRGEFFGTTHLEHIAGGVRFHTSRTDLQIAKLPGEVEMSNDADLSVTEGAGPVLLTTHSRNITFDRVSGDVSVTNRNGSVEITSAFPAGNITVQNKNGEVNLTLPESGFSVQADTSNGSINNDFGLSSTKESNNRTWLTNTVGRGGPTVRVITSESDINLHRTAALPLPAMPAMPIMPSAPETPAMPAPPAMPGSPKSPKHLTPPIKPAAPPTSNTF